MNADVRKAAAIKRNLEATTLGSVFRDMSKKLGVEIKLDDPLYRYLCQERSARHERRIAIEFKDDPSATDGVLVELRRSRMFSHPLASLSKKKMSRALFHEAMEFIAPLLDNPGRVHSYLNSPAVKAKK